MTDVRAVLFDLDDTLCRYRRPGSEVLAAAFERVGVDPLFPVAAYYDRYAEFRGITDDAVTLREEAFAAIAADRGHDPSLGRAVADAYTAERDQTNVEPLPGAADAVVSLAHSYRVALVTNGAPGMQAEKLSALPFADRFETVVHGGYDAAAKPDPEPFHVALDALAVPADRAVHVGNSLSSDVAGAHAAGVGSVWLDDGTTDPERDADPRPDHRVDSLHAVGERPWA
jgi:HAD superfamily hydrolase (TIGR01549 family)